jgi:hypothetical protein
MIALRYTERMDTPRPSILYKYVDLKTAWESLEDGTLAFTPASRFNDPFDINPSVDMNLSEQEFEILWRQAGQDKDMSLRDFIQRMRADIPAAEEKLKEHIYDMNNSAFGVSCFTEHENDPLMWAHYGERHKGAIIGFDTACGNMKKARPVDYRENRHVLRLGVNFDASFLRVKSNVWKLEAEWRLAANLDACRIKLHGEIPVFVHPIEKDAVVCIKFGCRMRDDIKLALALSLKKWGYDKCSVKSMKLSEKTYELHEAPYLFSSEKAALGSQGLRGESLGAE